MIALAQLGLRNKLRWVRLAGVFLASQAVVKIVSVAVGLLLVRLLPVDQYALYTVATALLALLVMGANLGISGAVITLGARLANDPQALGGLFNAGLAQSRWFYAATLPVFLGVAAVILTPHDWSLPEKALAVALVAAIGWFRVPTMIATAVLNVRHDSHGLFRIGMREGLTRLALVALCVVWPYATIALVAGFVGAGLARWTGQRQIKPLVDCDARRSPAQTAAIRGFVVPLVPIVIYTAFQGQIAVLVLSFFGHSTAIAEVGAIMRLNQIISLGVLLNPFLVQPVLARQVDRVRFTKFVGLIIIGLAAISTVVMASAFVVPNWWLLILGGPYVGLERELPVALATGMLILVGGTFYTVVIARNRTAGQYWAIAPSIAGQVAFAGLHGVTTTFDALILTLIPAAVYVVCQLVLIIQVFKSWNVADVDTR